MLPSRFLLANGAKELKQALQPYASSYAAAGILPLWMQSEQPETCLALVGMELRNVAPKIRQLVGTDAKLYPCWSDFGGKIEPQVDVGIMATAEREFCEETCNGFPLDCFERDSENQQLAAWSSSGRYVLFPRFSDMFISVEQLQEARREVVRANDPEAVAASNKQDFAWLPLRLLIESVKDKQPLLKFEGNVFVLHQFFSLTLSIPGFAQALENLVRNRATRAH